MPHRILIVDDAPEVREPIRHLLMADPRLHVDQVADALTALDLLERHSYSLLLTDLHMLGPGDGRFLDEVRRRQMPVAVIVMTGYGSIDKAVEAMRLGAVDFILKPVDPHNLRLVIARALGARDLQAEVAALRERLRAQFASQSVLSKSPKMHAVFELIQHAALATTTVLLEAEPGSCKEQVARAVHLASAAHRPGDFVAVNCAAVPENLLESTLFGHEHGSHEGVVVPSRGRFEQAQKGTLFLDEVGDIPAAMQVKLLRVLQERRFERVGGSAPIEVDVRVVAATNRGLDRLVRQGKFREDLYYRLNVVRIDLPPLRERPEDVPLLAAHFARRYARPGEPPWPIAPAAMEALLRYHWPGNVRELENALERACVVCPGPAIELAHLPAEVAEWRTVRWWPDIDLNRPLPELIREAVAGLEKEFIRQALRKTRGSVMRCADICGISRRSISTKLNEYGIDKAEFRSGRKDA